MNMLAMRSHLRHTPLLAACLMAAAPWSALQAQTAPVSPGAVQQQQQQEQERRLLEERLSRPPAPPELRVPRASEPAPAVSGSVQIQQVLIDDSQVLDRASIEAVIRTLVGRTVSLSELQAAVAAINSLYDAKGYATARAFLPPQTVKDGVVRIRLVEARVGALRVVGNTAVSSAYVMERLGLRPGQVLNTGALEQALARFNRLNETRVEADVQAGSSFGTTDVEIKVTEPRDAKFTAFVDNAGRNTVGEVRAGVTARLNNVARSSDSLQFSVTNSRGSESFAIQYATPLTADDLKLELSANRGDINVVAGPFQALGVQGQSKDLTVGLSYPWRVTPQALWNVYGRASKRESVSILGGASQGNVGFGLLTLGSLGEVQAPGSSWYLDNNLTLGVPRNDGGESFVVYRGNLTRFDRLSPRLQLLTRGSLQLSDSALVPSSEQFQVGGAQSVRGYSSGLLSGRNGYLVSTELRVGRTAQEQAARGPGAAVVQGLLFLDHGSAIPFRGGKQTKVTGDDFLTSVGVGAQVDMGSGFSARAVLAHGLRINPSETNQKRPHLHLSMNLALE